MHNEFFVDKISNINVQGSVISVDLARLVIKPGDEKTQTLDTRVTITLTGANFISLVNSLNQTVKAISERQNNMAIKDQDTISQKKT